MATGQEPKEIKINFPQDLQGGVYSNNMVVSHTKEEFILDFIMVAPPAGAVTARVIVGHPVEEIRSFAEKEDVSLIAISSQGAAAIKKGRIGSTAYDVANSATRPILILRRAKIAFY